MERGGTTVVSWIRGWSSVIEAAKCNPRLCNLHCTTDEGFGYAVIRINPRKRIAHYWCEITQRHIMGERPMKEKSEERDYGEVLIEISGILDLAMAILRL